jgi:hypothetical protein
MKPMHAAITRLRYCPCCQSKHSAKNSGKGKRGGKSAARQKLNREMTKLINERK